MYPSQAIFLILESALGAFAILLLSALVIVLGAYSGFFIVWFILFALYIIARLIVMAD